MTNKTESVRALEHRLDFLHTIQSELDHDELASFRAMLIGALSAEVSDDQWHSCLETALRTLANTREHRHTCACGESPDEPVS